MINRFLSISIIIALVIAITASSPRQFAKYKMNLSEYDFFEGNIADMKPKADVIPYSLNTPLFTDYAEKLRFVRLPEGQAVTYDDKEVLNFPVGTVIMKTFYYHNDARKPEKGRRLLETRVLIHNEDGWDALPYIWNDDQSDAYLDVAGETKLVSWKDEKGKKQKFDYIVPNKNQCKGCHNYNNKFLPIGPTARQLNGKLTGFDHANTDNQIKDWIAKGILSDAPKYEDIPKIAVWNDPSTGSVSDRARAWLDINCAHCHNPKGPAKTSGLNLYIHETDSAKLGVYKAPIAAGRGAADRQFNIVPGEPDGSILLYRIQTTDPGEMMPELGRSMVHTEGVALVREWIKGMEK